MIAHQWRQPLNSLSLMIQGVVFKYKLGKLDDALMLRLDRDTKEQIRQMSQTIDDFRDFFKPDKEAEVFSVNASILHAVTLLQPIFTREQIMLKMELEENISIVGFTNELGQSLINLLNNAKDVLLEKNIDKEKRIRVILKTEGSHVVIYVEDSGGGIPEDIIETIFDPYFSTKKEKNGTGLGLYMSKTIIEDHCNGELSVKNGRDGAVFKIVLKESND